MNFTWKSENTDARLKLAGTAAVGNKKPDAGEKH
jgi:hypothetical protein